ncbi:multi-sensor hybrid histidine kinase [Chthoniobacter flavus Ellin428]|uniref:histidine kinase n=1 Tax=Chthoniobacter flavus Ellin428 TaxID=497964 RepID=B4D5V2_9BACT|nr:response regulator [Chthoniobacter flavus]EDY18155.1 multi-sensor hybrid histidine kinase [Chthoniobacter flavus Ellin428]TCO91491.1 PAS domain S-box-containing protein [Chthoniobacter flavus]
MHQAIATVPKASGTVEARRAELFEEQKQNIIQHTDWIFARLMPLQWIGGIIVALFVSPRTWAGTESQIHPHIWAAVLLGGAITSLPVFLTLNQPGKALTRHTVAIGQMLMSALLIHLTGGRIETHFHVFGSLAILAFYRDWRVLMSATTVVYIDHLARGYFWPQSVYGVLAAPVWRSLEHAAWVIFEVAFLVISIRKSQSEMFSVAARQAELEALNANIEGVVEERTAELIRENAERRQAEQRLKKSQAQLAQAQQIAHVGSWEWDIVADSVTWSDETGRLYGQRSEDLGSPMAKCFQRVHPEDAVWARSIMEEAMRNLKPFECEHRVVTPGGIERVIHSRGEIVADARGRAIRMIGTAQDITAAKRAAEALRQSDEKLRQSQKMEAVGRLAGGVAHDFNNLLTVITGYSDLLLRELSEANPLREDAEQIQHAAARAAALTRQLLAFSRKQVLQPRVLELNGVVANMGAMLRRLIGEDIELRTSFDSLLGQVKADQGQIEQVILNLAVNARDAMLHGGKLTIQTANVYLDQKSVARNRELEVGEYVMLAISDTGVGMSEEIQAHLFEPFFSTKGVGKGTGLGLATCYGIVCQSGGDIRVYSEPGTGSTFKIYLPRLLTSSAEISTPKASGELPRGQESVLMVEDDSSVRKLAASLLRSCGYQIQEAVDAIEALAIIDRHGAFDLVITDVIMPQMSGKELYSKIMQRAPGARVLFMSGYTDDALAHHGVLDEGLHFLEKPFSPARLAQKVRTVLDNTAGE